MTLSADSLPLANVDGQLLPLAEVRLSALDRGFLLGDAVYEVLRVYGGKPWLADEHFTRLARSLEAIRVKCRSEEHTRELQSLRHLVSRRLLARKKRQPEHNAAKSSTDG